VNAIAVKNLGKKFKLFQSQGGRFLEYISTGRIPRHSDFWALQDITFEIPAGMTLGILGQNGSGKSTLLSILAGVLEPSAGSFEINGKVSAILELGSGFHPEFSGRDNVYMYGSIMGLSKQEVDDRYDEIVRFSELGDFINQPLRTYSSGMIVRLAFSVAVNVNADILIVDEALSVGDAIFQHRCFRKIREMQEAGKTILYVGHDIEAVRNLCTSALLLDGGRIIERGDPSTVVNKYQALITERERTYTEGNLLEHGEVPGDGYETVYDFIRNLREAYIINDEAAPVQVQTVEVQSISRKVIFAHPASTITYSITIEPGTSLAFAIGIMPYAWDKITQGVKFDIEVFFEGKTETIFSRVLNPNRNIGERGWHNFILPLEKFSEKTVSLVFSTSGPGNDLSYCWSAWGWGKIVTHKGRIENKQISDTQKNVEISHTESRPMRMGSQKGIISSVQLFDKDEIPQVTFKSGDLSIIDVMIVPLTENEINNLSVSFYIFNKFSILYARDTWQYGLKFKSPLNDNKIHVRFKQYLPLGPGTYSITISVSNAYSRNDFEILDRISEAIIFQVEPINKFQTGCIDLKSTIEIL
jgi:ABC-type polysaccharide/polyol phosphate transport system ATPase subunit